MKAAGCIVVGKTNMPEFGLGSHTFNELFGLTPNAWDASRSAGGSSGGAAVALAQRLLPVRGDFIGLAAQPNLPLAAVRRCPSGSKAWEQCAAHAAAYFSPGAFRHCFLTRP